MMDLPQRISIFCSLKLNIAMNINNFYLRPSSTSFRNLPLVFNTTFKKESVLEVSIVILKMDNKNGNKYNDYRSKFSVTWDQYKISWEIMFGKDYY